MAYYVGKEANKVALSHYGILGMKWGVRKYQNADGTLTEAGKKRYGTVDKFNEVKAQKQERSARRKQVLVKTAKVAAGVGKAAALGYMGYKQLMTGQYAGAINSGVGIVKALFSGKMGSNLEHVNNVGILNALMSGDINPSSSSYSKSKYPNASELFPVISSSLDLGKREISSMLSRSFDYGPNQEPSIPMMYFSTTRK